MSNNGWGGARPGAGRKRKALPTELVNDSIDKLHDLVRKGDVQAIRMVMERHIPALRAVSTGIDAKLVEAKILEITVLAKRLDELEKQLNNNGKED